MLNYPDSLPINEELFLFCLSSDNLAIRYSALKVIDRRGGIRLSNRMEETLLELFRKRDSIFEKRDIAVILVLCFFDNQEKCKMLVEISNELIKDGIEHFECADTPGICGSYFKIDGIYYSPCSFSKVLQTIPKEYDWK